MNRFSLKEVVDILNDNDPNSVEEETNSDEEMEGSSSNSIEITDQESNSSPLYERTCTQAYSAEPITVIISEESNNHHNECIVLRGRDLPSLNNETDASTEMKVQNVTTDENNNTTQTDDSDIDVKRSRKRQRNPDTWKETIRKRRRQSGLEYTSSRGKHMRKREVKTQKDCQGKCRFKCARLFTDDERQQIFSEFWKLTDEEKNTYYANTTDKHVKERQRTKAENSKRKASIQYYFVKGMDRVRICKEFYLSTLDISSKRVE